MRSRSFQPDSGAGETLPGNPRDDKAQFPRIEANAVLVRLCCKHSMKLLLGGSDLAKLERVRTQLLGMGVACDIV